MVKYFVQKSYLIRRYICLSVSVSVSCTLAFSLSFTLLRSLSLTSVSSFSVCFPTFSCDQVSLLSLWGSLGIASSSPSCDRQCQKCTREKAAPKARSASYILLYLKTKAYKKNYIIVVNACTTITTTTTRNYTTSTITCILYRDLLLICILSGSFKYKRCRKTDIHCKTL